MEDKEEMKGSEVTAMGLAAFFAALITWLVIKFGVTTELGVPILVAGLTSLAWIVGRSLGNIFRD